MRVSVRLSRSLRSVCKPLLTLYLRLPPRPAPVVLVVYHDDDDDDVVVDEQQKQRRQENRQNGGRNGEGM